MAPSRSSKLESRAVCILLVDDDVECRRRIRRAIALSRVGNSVHEVSSGFDALDWLQRRGKYPDAPRPGLILLDVEMPGLDGVETLRRLRLDPRLADIPVVLMAGEWAGGASPLSNMRCAGVCVAKPMEPDDFLRTILVGTDFWISAEAPAGGA